MRRSAQCVLYVSIILPLAVSNWLSAPLIEAVEYEEIDFANSFAEKSPFRGPPTAEMDEAWDKLWKFGGVNIPAQQFQTLNRSHEKTYQRVDEERGGGYAGMIEGFHQLHCLVGPELQ